MTCPRCGSEISALADRCSRCAMQLGQTVATGVLTPPPLAPTTAPSSSSRSNHGDPPTSLPAAQEAPTVLPAAGEAATGLLGDPITALPGSDSPTGGGVQPAPGVDSGPLKAGQAFGSRYHIIRALGVGGMGAVYQAWDAELGVAVAIKVIRPEVMEDPQAAAEVERRFKRELLLARQVTHKNVVRIHDLGEIDGIKYITMSYVDGVDLASMLKRDGRVPIPLLMRVARAVVTGLVEAHKAGVVHRDLKPANIMIDKAGDALIMDFGIARSAGGPAADAPAAPAGLRKGAAAEATQYGAVIGTVEYMAPEQAMGRDVDQRADIYAFGLMLYDMVVGRDHRSKTSPSAIEELKSRIEKAPAPIKTIVPEIPDALANVITRCVEPDASKRFQTSADLSAELDRLDENGVPIPIKRVIGAKLASAIAVVLLAVAGGAWWYAGTLVPEAPHAAVSVVISDIQNGTGDATFDHALELVLKRALEGAGFISAFDRNGMSRIVGVQVPETFDEAAAVGLAVKQGLGVVVSGAITQQGNGYDVALKATEAVTGNVVANARGRASGKDQVVPTATRLVATVRKALGDKTSESQQIFTMSTVSATSLDVVRHYAAAMEAQSLNRFEDARQSFLKAVELDPKFGIGYQGLATVSRNLGRLEDADKYSKQALQYLDGMTERERFSTRGLYYRVSGDYQQCVKEYGEMVTRYAGDVVGRNQRALCLSKLRDLRSAVEDMKLLVQILPKRTTFRVNLALYSDYSSDFPTAEKEARAIEEPDEYTAMAIAFAQLGQGQLKEAAETYEKLAPKSPLGASFSASGLADLALYEGRMADAVRGFEEGAAADIKAEKLDKAAAKLVAAAYVKLVTGHAREAAASADKALAASKSVPIRFRAARIFLETGAIDKAKTLAAGLAAELPVEPQAHAKIIEGEIALKNKEARQAIKLLDEANELLDTWVAHFDLGRAYLELGALPQADSEFDRCLKRRGEGMVLFVDEEPTYGQFPVVHYYQGRVREALKNARYADSYRAYLDIRGKSTEDPLLPEVRKRAGASQ